MKLNIPDMSCAHCKATIEKTIVDLDDQADVVVDLSTKSAEVTSTLPTEAILNALKSEGYPATVAAG